MKKYLLLIILSILFVFSCKNSSDSQEKIRKQIAMYEKQIEVLSKKIEELNSKLNDSIALTGVLVEVDTIKKQNFESYIELVANIEAENFAYISPLINGQVIKIYVQEGQFVKKGTLLAKINDEVLQRNLAQLQTNLLLADTLYRKQKALYEQNVISEVQYLQAKNQKEALEKNIDVIKTQIQQTNIVAPFDGIVDKIDIREGEMPTMGKPIMQIVNLNKMIAKANVSEKYLPYVNIGDKVVLKFSTYEDLTITTTIAQKGNIIDPSTRTFWIKAIFQNPQQKVKPNMIANMRLKSYEAKDVIYVPTNILAKDFRGWYVYVVTEVASKLFAKKIYVEPGYSDAYFSIIKKGLKPNDVVVIKGYNNLSDNQLVVIKNR